MARSRPAPVEAPVIEAPAVSKNPRIVSVKDEAGKPYKLRVTLPEITFELSPREAAKIGFDFDHDGIQDASVKLPRALRHGLIDKIVARLPDAILHVLGDRFEGGL